EPASEKANRETHGRAKLYGDSQKWKSVAACRARHLHGFGNAGAILIPGCWLLVAGGANTPRRGSIWTRRSRSTAKRDSATSPEMGTANCCGYGNPNRVGVRSCQQPHSIVTL